MSGDLVIGFALVGFAISWLSIPLIQRYLGASSQRQLHHTHGAPICRFGGLAIALPFAAVAIIAGVLYPASADRTHDRWIIVLTSLAMFGLGAIDDGWPLGAKRKLLGQILIASAVCYGGIQIETFRNPFTGTEWLLGGWGWFATVFWLVGFTNLINLIDGVDGLAGGVSLCVMGLLLYVGFQSDLNFALICAAGVCGALLGFLYYNFPPAKIYLGDGGAYFLGFLIGMLALVHSQKGTVAAALVAPLFALALPIADVGLAIIRRGLKGLPIFRADRGHLHHRLAEAGLSRTRIVLGFYGCSLFFLLLAFGVFASQGRWVPLCFGAGCLGLLIAARSFSFSREWFAVGKVLGNSLEVRKLTRYSLALHRCLELEAERCGSLDELWADFGCSVKKLGFTTVTLVTPQGRKLWKSPPPRPSQNLPLAHRFRCDFAQQCSLEFVGPASLMESRTFTLMSELAAESWHKASARWQAVHPVPSSGAAFPECESDVPVARVPVGR